MYAQIGGEKFPVDTTETPLYNHTWRIRGQTAYEKKPLKGILF